jgi:putative transposase
VTVYRHISAERAHCTLPVSLMCRMLGVFESGCWGWVSRPPSDRALGDAWLTERIRRVHEASGGRYGSPRVHALLRREGIRVGEKRVARLMALAGLQGAHRRRRRKGGTTSVEGVEPFGDLVGRDFGPDAPDKVWAADIKQIRTGEGWLYLAAGQDLFSRRIVGWAMDRHMRSELVVDALKMAVRRRRPPEGTIDHCDHGGQYIGLSFGQTCHDAGIAQSMGAVGSCFDNAAAETFFATLTKELLLHNTPKKRWATRAELRSAVFEFIEGYYNPTRLHSMPGMRSPAEYEADHTAGDPDGLVRASTRAHAREKSVHNLRLPTATTTTTTRLHETGGGPDTLGETRVCAAVVYTR